MANFIHSLPRCPSSPCRRLIFRHPLLVFHHCKLHGTRVSTISGRGGRITVRRLFVLPSFMSVVAKELVSLVSSGKRTSTRFTRGLLPHRVHYDRARLTSPPPPPRFFSSSLSVSVYGFFFYDFGNDGAAVSSPGVDANYGESGESSQNCDGNFIFRLRRSFEPFQFLEVSIVNALHTRGHYLADIPSIQEH